MSRLAQLVSFGASYLALGCVEILFLCWAEGRKLADLAAGLLTYAIGPALAPFFYWAVGKGDFFVSRREDRPLLFLPGVASYAVGAILFASRGFLSLAALETASLVAGLALLAVTLERKISVHTAVTAISAVLLAIGHVVWLLSAPFVPLAAWARVKLGAHDWEQAAAGAAVGLLAACLCLVVAVSPGSA